MPTARTRSFILIATPLLEEFLLVVTQTLISWDEPLKPVFDAELHDTRIARRGRNPAEGARVEIRDGVSPVEVVEQIEDFEPQLELPGGGKRHEPRQGHVGGPETGTLDAVVPMVAVCARHRIRKSGGAQVV